LPKALNAVRQCTHAAPIVKTLPIEKKPRSTFTHHVVSRRPSQSHPNTTFPLLYYSRVHICTYPLLSHVLAPLPESRPSCRKYLSHQEALATSETSLGSKNLHGKAVGRIELHVAFVGVATSGTATCHNDHTTSCKRCSPPTFYTQILGRDCLCLGCRSADVDATVPQCCCCAVQCSCSIATAATVRLHLECHRYIGGESFQRCSNEAGIRCVSAALVSDCSSSVPGGLLFTAPTHFFFINSAYSEGQDLMWWRQKDEIGWMKCIRGMDIML
jgi:hypothetical protein